MCLRTDTPYIGSDSDSTLNRQGWRSGAWKDAPVPDDRTVTIAEAAELAGVTKATIRSRIARGTLKAVKRGELRRIHVAELQRVGLIEDASRVVDAGEPTPVSADELLDRLQQQATELGEARAELARLARELEAERVLRERAERREK